MATIVLNTKISEVGNKLPEFKYYCCSYHKTGEVEDINLDHAKYITTKGFNELAVENFAARLKQASLVSKIDFDNKLIRFKGSTT